MDTIKEAATQFLTAKRVAVTGVSRDAKGHGPLMFDPTADGAHKCMKFFLSMSGAVPRRVS